MTVNLKSIDLGGGTAAGSTRKTALARSPSSQAGEASQQAGSEVTITSTASLLARLQRALAAQPAVDRNRVEQIGQALASGSYSVHPGKIAHGLISTEHTLSQLTEN